MAVKTSVHIPEITFRERLIRRRRATSDATDFSQFNKTSLPRVEMLRRAFAFNTYEKLSRVIRTPGITGNTESSLLLLVPKSGQQTRAAARYAYALHKVFHLAFPSNAANPVGITRVSKEGHQTYGVVFEILKGRDPLYKVMHDVAYGGKRFSPKSIQKPDPDLFLETILFPKVCGLDLPDAVQQDGYATKTMHLRDLKRLYGERLEQHGWKETRKEMQEAGFYPNVHPENICLANGKPIPLEVSLEPPFFAIPDGQRLERYVRLKHPHDAELNALVGFLKKKRK